VSAATRDALSSGVARRPLHLVSGPFFRKEARFCHFYGVPDEANSPCSWSAFPAFGIWPLVLGSGFGSGFWTWFWTWIWLSFSLVREWFCHLVLIVLIDLLPGFGTPFVSCRHVTLKCSCSIYAARDRVSLPLLSRYSFLTLYVVFRALSGFGHLVLGSFPSCI